MTPYVSLVQHIVVYLKDAMPVGSLTSKKLKPLYRHCDVSFKRPFYMLYNNVKSCYTMHALIPSRLYRMNGIIISSSVSYDPSQIKADLSNQQSNKTSVVYIGKLK